MISQASYTKGELSQKLSAQTQSIETIFEEKNIVKQSCKEELDKHIQEVHPNDDLNFCKSLKVCC